MKTPPATPAAGRPTDGRVFPKWLAMVLALTVIACAYLYRLDRPLLWADEAQTGIGARNVLRVGYPSAFDGRNAAVIDSGRTLDRNLAFKQIPWTTFYVGAASLAMFGDDTAGLRALFAIIGVLAFFPIHAVLRKRVRWPCLVTTLVLLAPQTVLFQRSARYYPLLICLFSLLLWHVTTDFTSRRVRFALAAVLFVLLFHTHVAVALCCGFSVLLFCALRRRAMFRDYVVAVGLGLVAWIVWYQSLASSLGVAWTQLSLLASDLGRWFVLFGGSLLATVIDFDVVGAAPLILWAGLLGWLLLRKRGALRAVGADPIVAFIVISVLVQSVASAAVFGEETGFHYSHLRYHAHLVVALMLLGFIAVNAAVDHRNGRILLCAGWWGSNLLALSFWVPPEGRTVPVSWLPPVLSEVFEPRAEAWDQAIAKLRAGQDAAATRDQVIIAVPPWVQEVALFYLGDRYLVPPLFTPDANAAVDALHHAVGDDAFARLTASPTWILDSLGVYTAAPDGFDVAAVLPSPRSRPDDGTRPELTRHTFAEARDVANVRLFRRRE